MSRDYDTQYVFKEEYCFNRQEKKSRLEKQLGDFGEQLIMTILGRMKKYRVAYVDHEGADLIASDDEGRRYAISVKSRQMGRYKSKKQNKLKYESNTVAFKKADQIKLCKFSEDFNLIPVVAFVIVSVDFSFADVFIIALDDFFMLANAGNEVIETTGNKNDSKHLYPQRAISINGNGDLELNNPVFCAKTKSYFDNDPYVDYLQKSPYIQHLRLDLNGRLDASTIGSKDVRVPILGQSSRCDQLLEEACDKDQNLTTQFGDFGENMVMYVLNQLQNYKVALVDHVGIDLIATNPITKNRYGISVKAQNIKGKNGKTNTSHTYNQQDLEKITQFCESFQLIPAVAYVFADKAGEYSSVDIYILTLKNLIIKGVQKQNKGITAKMVKTDSTGSIDFETVDNSERINETVKRIKTISFKVAGKNLKSLRSCPEIKYISFKFNSNSILPEDDL